MIYTDRSRVECGQRCERERFHQYHWLPTQDLADAEGVTQLVPGVVPERDSLDLLFGTAVHAFGENCQNLEKSCVAAVDELYSAKTDLTTTDGVSVLEEYKALYVGLTETFRRFTLPQLERDYYFMGAEVESTMLLAPGVNWMSRIDGALRRKSDGLWFTLETKTSSYPETLLTEAATNFQLLMEVESMRRHYGLRAEQLGGALLLVFNKGRKQPASAAEKARGLSGYRRLSPFTYWYAKDLANGTTTYQLPYKAGYERRPVWNIPNYLDIAFDNFADELKGEVQLFPSVSFDPARVTSVITQVVARERTFDDESLSLDEAFGQNFRQCENSGGFKRKCAYKALCFNANAASNPYSAGYTPRLPNHPQEGE